MSVIKVRDPGSYSNDGQFQFLLFFSLAAYPEIFPQEKRYMVIAEPHGLKPLSWLIFARDGLKLFSAIQTTFELLVRHKNQGLDCDWCNWIWTRYFLPVLSPVSEMETWALKWSRPAEVISAGTCSAGTLFGSATWTMGCMRDTLTTTSGEISTNTANIFSRFWEYLDFSFKSNATSLTMNSGLRQKTQEDERSKRI